MTDIEKPKMGPKIVDLPPPGPKEAYWECLGCRVIVLRPGEPPKQCPNMDNHLRVMRETKRAPALGWTRLEGRHVPSYLIVPKGCTECRGDTITTRKEIRDALVRAECLNEACGHVWFLAPRDIEKVRAYILAHSGP